MHDFSAAVRRLLQDDGRHPAPYWCKQCGRLGCFEHYGRSYASPIPPARTDSTTVANRRRTLSALARIARRTA